MYRIITCVTGPHPVIPDQETATKAWTTAYRAMADWIRVIKGYKIYSVPSSVPNREG